MERAVKDYCDKPDRLDLQNPSAWFTHHAHELCFRADPEQLEAGARDWLNGEKTKAAGRDRDRQKAAMKGRGGGGGGGCGRRGSGGGERFGTGGRGGASANDRGGRGAKSWERSGERTVVKIEGLPTVPAGTESEGWGASKSTTGSVTNMDADAEGGMSTSWNGTTRKERGSAGGVELSEHNAPRHTGKSDLMSIFPSLRGRGGGSGSRQGGRGGRGGGGRGFRQGG